MSLHRSCLRFLVAITSSTRIDPVLVAAPSSAEHAGKPRQRATCGRNRLYGNTFDRSVTCACVAVSGIALKSASADLVPPFRTEASKSSGIRPLPWKPAIRHGVHQKKQNQTAHQVSCHSRALPRYSLTLSSRDLDLIHADLRSIKHLTAFKTKKPAEDLPGLGQFYCIECAKFFEGEHNLVVHRKGKNHKRRVRMLKEKPYTQKEAEAATGLGVNTQEPEPVVETAMDIESTTA